MKRKSTQFKGDKIISSVQLVKKVKKKRERESKVRTAGVYKHGIQTFVAKVQVLRLTPALGKTLWWLSKVACGFNCAVPAAEDLAFR